MEHFYYFFDESGNSGSRFWDSQQPTYVEAGWALETSRIQGALDAIRRVEGSYPVKSKRVKGKDLVKHGRGQDFILKTIRAIGKSGGIPTVHIVEKKYWVCGKVVETFLDPFYNSKISYTESADIEKRQSIAQSIYDMDSLLLDGFAEAYRARDPSAIAANAVKWVSFLQQNRHGELADLIGHVAPTIQESIVSEFSAYDDPVFHGIDSMNLPVWFNIFQHIEQRTPGTCTIIHHRMDTFESAYLSALEMLRNASEGIIAFKDRQWVYPLRNILGMSFETTDNSPLIRSADFIASSVAQYINLAVCGRNIPVLLHRTGFCTLGIFLMDLISYKYPQLGPPLNLGSIIGSSGWLKTILDTLRASAEHMRGV